MLRLCIHAAFVLALGFFTSCEKSATLETSTKRTGVTSEDFGDLQDLDEEKTADASALVTIEKVSPTSVRVDWTPPAEIADDTADVEYAVYYSTEQNIDTYADAVANGLEAGKVRGSETSIFVTNLSADQTYFFNVFAINSATKKVISYRSSSKDLRSSEDDTKDQTPSEKDTVPPTISSVSAPSDGIYPSGQALSFTVAMSEPVTVTGTPRLALDINGSTTYANYVSGSGSDSLVFTYTVTSGQSDSDGIGVSASIDLNDGAIIDSAGNAATLTFSAVDTSEVLVDSVLPKISSVTAPSNGTYVSGDNLDFVVTTDSAVTVTGTPRIALTVGSFAAYAVYTSSGSPTSHIFRYTVAANLVDADGVSIGSQIDPNGGAIVDSVGNNIETAFSAPVTTSVLVDSKKPSVISMNLPSDGAYKESDALDFTLTFSEIVTVTGIPRLALTVGGATKYATYQSGSASSALVFRYSVGSGDNDSDGIAINSAIDLNSGTIKDSANNDASLSVSVGNSSGITVDTTAASVSSVVAPADGSYKEGSSVNTSIVFDEAVTVTGTPRIPVAVGGSTVYATYASGTTTNTLVFTYTVGASDSDTDGIVLSSPIELNSGSITDAAGNASALTFSVPDTSAVLVDTTAPATSSATLVSNGDYVTSSSVSVTINFDSIVVVTGTPYVNLGIGGSTKQAAYASGSNSNTLVFTYTVTGSDNDQDGISVSSPIVLNSGAIKDVAGNDSALTFSPPDGSGITVNYINSAPVVSGTCSTTGTQDVAYSCNPSVSDSDSGDTQTWSFANTNDCTWASIDSSTGAVSGTPTDENVESCTLALKTNDTYVDSNVLTTTVTIANVAPTLSISNAANIMKGASSSVIRTDGDVEASEEGHGIYSLNNSAASSPKCSDNALVLSIDSSTGAITFQPAASYAGTCYIKVQFDDQNASSNTVNSEFTISVISLEMTPSTASVEENGQITFSATGGSTPYTYSIASGGGSIDSSTGVYTAPNYTGSATVRVTDNDGATSDATVTITPAVHTYLNPSDKGANISLADGNSRATTSAGSWQIVRAAHGHSSGKWYWEATVNHNVYAKIGVATSAASLTTYPGAQSVSWSFNTNNGYTHHNASGTAYTSTPSIGDVIGVALDLDNGTIEFYKNGESLGIAYSNLSGTLYPVVGVHSSGNISVNFGHSDFVYGAPTGFYPGFATDVNATLPVAAANPYESVYVATSSYFQFAPTGGSTPYSYSLVSGDGSIDSSTGVYSSSGSSGTATIRVTDFDGDTSDVTISTVTGASLNPSDKDSSIVLSNNNLTATGGTSGWKTVRATKALSSGKWYWEATSQSAGNNMQVGILNATGTLANYIGSTSDGYAYTASGHKHHGGGYAGFGSAYTSGDVIGVALDLDNGTIKFYKNGTALGTAYTGISGVYYPAVAIKDASNQGTVNFGSSSFSHTVPYGYLPVGPIHQSLSLSDATGPIAKNETYAFAATGGKPPYTYSVVSGGGSIDSSAGVYTAPSSPSSVTVRVTDDDGDTSDASITVLEAVMTTFNPDDKHADIVLASDDTNVTISSAYAWRTVRAAHGHSSGKWYWEVTVPSTKYVIVGVAPASTSLANYIGYDSVSWGVRADDGKLYNSNATSAYAGAGSNGDVIGVALDMDNGTLSFYVNGVSKGVAATGLSGTYYPAVTLMNQGHTPQATANFGTSSFSYPTPFGYYSGFSEGTAVTPDLAAADPYGSAIYVYPSGYYDLSPAGGTAPYSYSIVSGGGSVDSSGRFTASASNGTSTVRVTDADGSTSDVDIIVTDANNSWSTTDKSTNMVLSNNDLTVTPAATTNSYVRAQSGQSSGKWYWEITIQDGHFAVGISEGNSSSFSSWVGAVAGQYSYRYVGDKYGDGSTSGYGASYGGFGGGPTVIGVALDMDNGTVEFFKNGTSQGVAFTGLSGTFYPMVNSVYGGSSSYAFTANFGDSAFTHTVPTGFSAGFPLGGGW